MGILPYQKIIEKIKKGEIKIKPSDGIEKRIGPCGVDLRLGEKFKAFKKGQIPYIDLQEKKVAEELMEEIKTEDFFLIHPHEFVLGETLEEIEIPLDLSAKLEGRSSLGRLGIQIHSTAGHFDPGFSGKPTLEISNIGELPVKLYPKMPFCQMIFQTLTEKTQKPYSGKYKNPKSVEVSKIFEEFQ